MAGRKQGTPTYDASSLRELRDLEPLRQSPAQYIGDTSAVSAENGTGNEHDGEVLTAGGRQLFVETVSNSSDEATNMGPDGRPYADLIRITLHKDQSITVQDNGRGVPPDINPATGKSGMVLCWASLNAGGKFKDPVKGGSGSYKTAQGLHGVGAKCVNALSDRFDATVYRDGYIYEMSTKRGVFGRFDGDAIDARFTELPDGENPVTRREDDRDEEERARFPHGTKVRWHPDNMIWGGTDIPVHDIYAYTEAQSYMAPMCRYVIVNEMTGKTTEFYHPGGITDMIDEKTAKGTNISPTITFDVPTSYTKRVITDNGDGTQGSEEVTYDCDVKVALRWRSSGAPDVEGYANGVHCAGKHVDGLRRGLSRGVGDWIKSASLLTQKDQKDGVSPNIDDITDGMVAVVEVLLEEQCSFTSQTKEVLNNPEVLSCVSDSVKEQIGQWLGAKKNAAAAKRIGKSIVSNARLRAKQKKEREAAKKVKDFEKSTSWPEKLTNCSHYDDPRSELIIVEGDSAANPCRAMRDSRFQAVFPIRGKIKNTFDLPLQGNGRKKGVLDNIEAASILKIYQHYNRIIILSDSDPDGAHIEVLVYILFYKHMPEVVQEGRIFAVDAPLFVITTLDDDKTYLAKNNAEKEEILARLRKEGKKIKTPISRLKGWGECPPELVEETCLNPETRVLRRLTIKDMERAEETLRLAMGGMAEDIEDRKKWLIDRLSYGNIKLFT